MAIISQLNGYTDQPYLHTREEVELTEPGHQKMRSGNHRHESPLSNLGYPQVTCSNNSTLVWWYDAKLNCTCTITNHLSILCIGHVSLQHSQPFRALCQSSSEGSISGLLHPQPLKLLKLILNLKAMIYYHGRRPQNRRWGRCTQAWPETLAAGSLEECRHIWDEIMEIIVTVRYRYKL